MNTTTIGNPIIVGVMNEANRFSFILIITGFLLLWLLVREDLHWCEGAIERYVDVPVTLNEFSAMVAFCYNVGSGKTRKSSIVKRVNIDDRPGAANAFLLWNRMNGVVMSALAKRRARERTLFITP